MREQDIPVHHCFIYALTLWQLSLYFHVPPLTEQLEPTRSPHTQDVVQLHLQRRDVDNYGVVIVWCVPPYLTHEVTRRDKHLVGYQYAIYGAALRAGYRDLVTSAPRLRLQRRVGLLHGRYSADPCRCSSTVWYVPAYVSVHVILNPVPYQVCVWGMWGIPVSHPRTQQRIGARCCIHKTVQTPRGVKTHRGQTGT